ncbi:MAG TPA: HAMP domain-containing sensor histidine kinase [Allosphingosinicella sp.]|nr:HAMP domain-containing sensor histidine kinase [Allosphingosinicella sp.]
MIAPIKAFLKRHWPSLRLRTILLMTFVFVAALPGVGAVFLRVYENTLVRQTEAELIAQSMVLASAYKSFWTPDGRVPMPPEQPLAERPSIDLSTQDVLGEQAAPVSAGPVDPHATAVAIRLRPIASDAARTAFTAIRVLDRHGRVVLGRDDVGLSYAALPEVRDALAGRTATVLRERGGYQAVYWAEFLSRAAGIRVHHVRPVVLDSQVIGAIMLSRSPRGLFVGIYQDRGRILLGIALIFGTLVILAGLLSRGIARPIEALSEATQKVARGAVTVPDTPATAAVEIRALYENFGSMAERIERRSRYLRDFAAAVSHEFKTPIAGISGAIELLQDHAGTMSDEERRRFLANAAADAARLSLLLERLLHLARADMAVAAEDEATNVAAPLRAVADAMRGNGFVVTVEAAPDLPRAAAAAELIETVLQILIENSRQAGATAVGVAAHRHGDRIAIRVSDNGGGIPPADQERIFEPFHTGRREQGGTGLGLSIARSLLASCGGTVTALAAGTGACFEVELPAAA